MRRFQSICTICAASTLIVALLFPSFSQAVLFRNLKAGDSGADVRELQVALNRDPDTRISTEGIGSPGQETEYFGTLTKRAVVRFQDKHKSEVLSPVGLSSGTGYVGILTRAKIMSFDVAKTAGTENQQKPSVTVPIIFPTTINTAQIGGDSTTTPATSTKPEIVSVSPEYVSRGGTVIVTGKNFSPTGNTVELGDGPISKVFGNLSSPDGKTLTFIYEPPVIETMTKEQILALPLDTLQQIQEPLAKAGVTLDDVMTPYKGIRSEAELLERLGQGGYTSESLYHIFYVIVKNGTATGISATPLLHGIRKFPFDTVAKNPMQSFFADMRLSAARLFGKLAPIPVAYAQMNGGGITTGIVFVCTCSAGLLTFQLDFAGGGTGLYAIPTAFLPNVGSCRVTGFWLGGYTIMGGTCAITIGYGCITLMGNTLSKPVGCST